MRKSDFTTKITKDKKGSEQGHGTPCPLQLRALRILRGEIDRPFVAVNRAYAIRPYKTEFFFAYFAFFAAKLSESEQGPVTTGPYFVISVLL